jgi:aldehyde dehydrogenase (NAD+)
LLATVSAADEKDVDIAVSAAKSAWEAEWHRAPGTVRRDLLLKLADLIQRDEDDFASLESIDAGVLFAESKSLNVANAIETLRYFAGWADKLDGKSIRIPSGRAYTTRQPIGVCAAIVPWNSPL